MRGRRELNSSDESNSSSGTQVSIGSAATSMTPYSNASVPAGCPTLSTPLDRPGRNGIRDRLQRRGRLTKSIQLSPEELRDILLYIYNNENNEGVHWTSEMLFKYVPGTFETAVVNDQSARLVLEKSIILNFFRHIPAVLFKSRLSDVSAVRHHIYVFSFHKIDQELIPTPLRNLPNVSYVEEPPADIRPNACIHPGCKISIPETASLRLDGNFSFGTLGFVGTIENLGPQRHVLVTTGHVTDEAPFILIHDTDGKTYNTEVVQQFKRFLGVPQYRLGKQDVPGPVSLNQACLLEQSIPNEILRCIFLSVDCCHFTKPQDLDIVEEDRSLLSRAPMLSEIQGLKDIIESEGGLRVYKFGAASGITTGILSDVEQPRFDVFVYVLKIRWDAPDMPFAVDGDSGSLVWAMDGTTLVPLGLHCGSNDTTSYALSLKSICEDISDFSMPIYCSASQKSVGLT